MPGVMTTLGLSKVAAAKAAGKKVIISKIAFGTVDVANGAWTNKATIGMTASLFRPNRFIYSSINKRTYFVNEQGVPNRVI